VRCTEDAEPFGAQQYDPDPPDVFLCGVAIADQAAKPIKIGLWVIRVRWAARRPFPVAP
jgi:hypothetical protein